MRTLPDSFSLLLGPLRPLLKDDDVTAVVLEGTQAAWVERVGAPPRPVEPLDADALRRVVDAVRAVMGPGEHPLLGAMLPEGGHVSVVETPGVGGGAVVLLETWRSRPVVLDELGPADLVDVVRGLLGAGVGILVTGGTAEMRLGLLESLLDIHPRQGRRLVVGTRPVRARDALRLPPPERHPAAVARFFAGVERLRSAAVCVPEMTWGGAPALHAAARVGRVLASVAGLDGESAAALLCAADPRAHALLPAAFRALLEFDDGEVPRLRALREFRAGPAGPELVTVWARTPGTTAGAWRAVPAWADRVVLTGTAPWGALPSITDGAGVMFAGRPTFVTQVPPTTGGDITSPGMPHAPELTAPILPPAVPPPGGAVEPPDDWDAATLQAPPSTQVLDALRLRRAAMAAVDLAPAAPPPAPPPPAPPPPLRTDVEADVASFLNTNSAPTNPRVHGSRNAPAPAPPEAPRASARKPGPSHTESRRAAPPAAPPTAPPAPPRTAPAPRPAGKAPGKPLPAEKADDLVTGDSFSGVFASVKPGDDKPQDD